MNNNWEMKKSKKLTVFINKKLDRKITVTKGKFMWIAYEEHIKGVDKKFGEKFIRQILVKPKREEAEKSIQRMIRG